MGELWDSSSSLIPEYLALLNLVFLNPRTPAGEVWLWIFPDGGVTKGLSIFPCDQEG